MNKRITEFLKKGRKYYDSNKDKQALKAYQKVLDLDRNNVEGLIGKGKALLALGDNKKALVCFTKALKNEPSNSEALHYKGHVFDESEKFEDAIIHYEKAYEMSKDRRIPAHVGFCFYNIEKWREAISWFDKGLDVDPNDADSLHFKGHSLQELNEHESAIQCFTKAYELDKDIHFLNQIGESYYYLNSIERSFEYLDRAIKVNPKDAEALITKSRIIGLRNFEEALNLLETAIKIDKNNPEVWEAKGNLLWIKGEEDEARKCFMRIKGQKQREKPKVPKETDISELIKNVESLNLEFKSSLSYPYDVPKDALREAYNKIRKDVEEATLSSIVSFLNTEGGELIIGVSPKNEVIGLDKDYEILAGGNCSELEKLDKWRLYLDHLIRDCIGKDVSSNYISVRDQKCDGKMLERIGIKKSNEPQFLSGYKDPCAFYIRSNSGKQKLNIKEATEYIKRHFNVE